MQEFTGKDLIRFVENYPQLQFLPIRDLFIELLKKNLIMPSDIIDAYSQVMQDKLMVAQSHYEDACVTALQMNSGNFTKKEDKKKMMDRFLYNASFSKSFPNMSGVNMTDEEKNMWSDFWLTTYGFRPEDVKE